MKKTFLAVLMALLTAGVAFAQKQDTVIVELAKTSRVIFTVGDRSDLEILKHYNFDQLFRDIIAKLESQDTSALSAETDTIADSGDGDDNDDEDGWSRRDDDDDDDDHSRVHVRSRGWGRTWHSFNFDLGTNNYLAEDGEFPDRFNAPYAVRPWGSWYVAVNSIQRSRVSKKFFIEWGLGVSWYTFKFERDNVKVVKGDNEVLFVDDTRFANYEKSKLSISYVQASMIPVLDFGDHRRKPRVWDNYRNSFRIGAGPYVGYRVSSTSKIVYEDGGREKDKDRDNFYLSNVRYGARLQLGYRSTDLFFNYDLNELFASQRGPKLNAFSFGVIF